MLLYFDAEKCIVEGHTLQEYPGKVRRAYSSFAKAKFECAKGMLLNFVLPGALIYFYKNGSLI